MTEHRSFVPSDFGLRDIPRIVRRWLLLSVICTFTRIVGQKFQDGVPPFLAGLLTGLGLGLGISAFVSIVIARKSATRYRETIDIDSLPELSANVQQICDGSSAAKKLKAVKAYCDETGLGVPEGMVAVEGYLAKEEQQSDSERPEDD